MSEPVRYEPWPGGWLFLGAMTALLIAIAVGTVVGTIATIEDPRTYPVNLAWIAVSFSSVYLYVVRLAFKLTFDGRVLMWSTLSRSGAVNVDEIIAIRSRRIMRGIVDLESNAFRTVSVRGTKRLAEFIDEIGQARPNIPVNVHRYVSGSAGLSRLSGRLSTSLAFLGRVTR